MITGRCRVNRLSHIDRVTGEPIRRYEHEYPGSMIHVDVTKFATSPTAAATGSSADNRATRTVQRLRANRAALAANL